MLCGCYGYTSVSTSIKPYSFISIHYSAIHSLKAKTACQMPAENPEGFASPSQHALTFLLKTSSSNITALIQ